MTEWRIMLPNPSTVPMRVSVEMIGSGVPASISSRA